MNNGGNMYDFRNDLNRQGYNPYNQQRNQQMMNMNYNQQFQEPKRKKGFGGFIIFLLLLVIVFLVLYIVDIKEIYDIPYMDKVDSFISSKFVKPADDDKDKKEETKPEEAITEEKTKEELMNKVLYMSTLDAERTSLTTLYAKDLKAEDLTDSQKLRIAAYGLSVIEDKYTKVTDEAEIAEAFKDLEVPEGETLEISSTTATTVSNRYQGLFGTKPELASIEDKCPMFSYVPNRGKVYLNDKCSETTINSSIHLYAYKFTKDDKHEYVYVSIGVSKLDEENEKVKIYSDYEAKKELKEIDTTEYDKFAITDKDYKDYSKYKFTFTKNESSNYVFEKIEQLKED